MTENGGSEEFGLDTSIVLRLITGLPEAQTSAAFAFVSSLAARGHIPLVSDLVLSEAYFALHAHYHVPKLKALEQLLQMLKSGIVAPEGGQQTLSVIEHASKGCRNPGFVDQLIHAQYKKLSRRLVTFEKASKKLAGTLLLK